MRTMILSDKICYFRVYIIQHKYISRHSLECRPSELNYKIAELVTSVDNYRSGTGFRQVASLNLIDVKELVYNSEYLVICATRVDVPGINKAGLAWHFRIIMEEA